MTMKRGWNKSKNCKGEMKDGGMRKCKESRTGKRKIDGRETKRLLERERGKARFRALTTKSKLKK